LSIIEQLIRKSDTFVSVIHPNEGFRIVVLLWILQLKDRNRIRVHLLRRYGIILLFTGILFISFQKPLFSQLRTPKYSNEFMNLGVGARALGMGNAQVAIAQDVSAAYWNPAGLNHTKDTYELGLMHASYFAGMANYDWLSFSFAPDTLSRFAVTAIRFAVDDIPDTRFLYDADGRLNYDNIQFFSAADYGFLLSYARKVSSVPGLNLGANVKIIHRSVGAFASAWGFGLDAGMQYQNKAWQFGLMVRDLTGTFNSWSFNRNELEEAFVLTGNAIPINGVELTVPRLILGAARSFQLGGEMGLLASADMVFTFDGNRNVLLSSGFSSMDPSLGLELNYRKQLFLRGGLNNLQRVRGLNQSESLVLQPNFGLGFSANRFRLDYALTDVGDMTDTPYSHIFSLMIGF
jgi:hypothetical protein